MSVTVADQQQAWALFGVRAVAARYLSPHLVRVTVGHDPSAAQRTPLAHFADCGFDQRIKMILPARPDGEIPLSDPHRWYRQLCDLPADSRPIARTYTVRAVRGAGTPAAEVDIDMVVHGTSSPASAWAAAAAETGAAGAPSVPPIALLGPDSRFAGDHRGRAFVTPMRRDLLIAGDETALPAIASILEGLDPASTGTVLIEIPTGDDVVSLTAPDGMKVDFLPRNGRAHGTELVAAALGWRPGRFGPALAANRENADSAGGLADLEGFGDSDGYAWDVPEHTRGIRAWIAGEAGAVREIRRHLIGTCALPRERVAFMGYWRLGRAEN